MEKAANDPILDTVSRSLVGKELIYFGANVLYQLEQAGNTISRFADLARADAQQLIAYAYTHEVPCGFTKPAVIHVKVQSAAVETYAPFTVYMTVGGMRFYNIDFVTTDREFTLYQGTPKAIVSTTGKYLDAFSLDTLKIIRQYQSWKLYKEFSEGRYLSSYLKLGNLAIPESVRVFARALDGADQGIVFPYTEYNQGLSDPAAKLYKVRTGWDRSVNVFFGDTNWSEQVNQEQYEYEIYYLDATVSNFTVTANNTLTLGEKSLTQKANADGESYTVSSYSMGEEASLSYARTSILAAQFLSQGLITEEQILNYVTSLDVVNSAKLLTNKGTHSVNVVVKPATPDNTEFGYLEDTLRQNGAIGVNYSVTVATAVDFSVTLTPIGSQSLQNMTRAQQVIEEYCSYENITLASQISSTTLNQVLQLAGIRGIIATISVLHEEAVVDATGSQTLSAPPVVNTLKLYDIDGNLIGFDSDGVFRRLDATDIIGGSQYIVSRVGDFLFISSSSSSSGTFFIDRTGDRLLATPANTLTDPQGAPAGTGTFFQSADNGMTMFLQSTGRVLAFSTSNSIRRGDASIFNRRTEIRALKSYQVVMPAGVEASAEYAPVLLNGFYYIVGKVGSTPAMYRGQLVNDTIQMGKDNIATINNTNKRSYFAYDGKFWCLNADKGSRSNQITYWDANSTDQYTLDIEGFDLVWISFVVQDGRAYISSIAQSDGLVEVVVGTPQLRNINGTNTFRITNGLKFQFENKDDAQAIINSWSPTFYLYTIPTDTEVHVCVRNGVATMTQNGVPLRYLEWKDAPQFVSEGSVDYNSGTVYGVYAPTSAYYAFDVAGVLAGDTTYPRYARR